MSRKHNLLFALYVLLGVFALSTSAIFVKLSSAPAPITALYRMFFSFILLLPFLLIVPNALADLRKITRKQWIWGSLSGAFIAVHYLLWFESLLFTSVASSTVLVTLQPLFAFIGGYLIYGERLRKVAVSGGVLSIVGSVIIGWGDMQLGEAALYGDILALLGAAAITAYFLIAQNVRKHMSLVPFGIIVYSTSSLFLLAYCLMMQAPLVGYPASDWLCFLGLAIIPTLMGQTIFNWLIKWLSASTISMSILGEPIGTCLLAYLIWGESITLPQALGSCVIFIGIYIFLRFNKSGNADGISENKEKSL
ncbi:DMT family transporter [Paenibacillus agricola]|uniref:DMT family transporter n=1 Tax=Paenibacillus agricola TaxID=2716264 RepID=UPI001A9F3385|nr:DMT family transporter [Paenibacillus agricola]